MSSRVQPAIHREGRPESQTQGSVCAMGIVAAAIAGLAVYFGMSRFNMNIRLGATLGSAVGAGATGALVARCLSAGPATAIPAAAPIRVTPARVDYPVIGSYYERASALAGVAQVNLPLIEGQSVPVLRRAGMWGQAMGDAVGVPAEFLSREQAHQLIPFEFNFEKARKIHNWVERFEPNGFSDDTEQSQLIARALILNHGAGPGYLQALAEQFADWEKNNFRERQGFVGPKVVKLRDAGNITGASIRAPGFAQDPLRAVRALWEGSPDLRARGASNGAIMRTSVLSLVFANDLQQLVSISAQTAKVTHADPRCIASAVALNMAMALLMRGATAGQATQTAHAIADALLQEECERYPHIITPEEVTAYREELQRMVLGPTTLQQLALGGPHVGYTYKTLGAAFYGLRRAQQLLDQGVARPAVFRAVIEEIVGEGGDADTNAAPTGALIAVLLQTGALEEGVFPETWLRDMARQEVLRDVLEKLPPMAAPE
jgi:ADP-ribosylglycohydrolase